MRVEDGIDDHFPVGMRVLAVDDDPTCLQVLANLLCRCDYQVTIANEATKALKLLRESKDKFDLVISDVYMPDMDGFKLLELVGLEMDLPVIMLSGNSDPSLVMKGITHGACDYLTKPVRIEELKNIWQHVIRRRYDSKGKRHNGPGDDQDKLLEEGEAVYGKEGYADLQNKVSKKRRDQNELEDYFEESEHAHAIEDSFTQKKPRVVWSADLHKKFLAAVNHLGVDKAVPKKILELMNDDKLTRENVASHLQKFRHSLRRISNAAAQQDIINTLSETKDTHHFSDSSYNVLEKDCLMNESNLLSNISLSYLRTGQAAGRVNNPLVLGCGPFPSPDVMQYSSQSHSPMNLHHLSMTNQQKASFLQVPQTLKLEEMPHNFFSTSPFQITSTGFKDAQQSLLSGEPDKSFLSFGEKESQDALEYVDVRVQMADPNKINGSRQCAVPLNGFSSATLPVNGVTFGGNHSNSHLFLNGVLAANVDGRFSQNMKMDFSDLHPVLNSQMGKSTNGNSIENHGHSTITQNKSANSFEDELRALIKQEVEDPLSYGDLDFDLFHLETCM